MQRPKRLSWRRYAAIAASILIAAGISVIWRTSPQEPALTFAEIEQRIEQSGRAARLLAAAELLAECPDAQSIVKQQYRYIVETYPQTAAAAQAKSRIQ
jgi:ERCC4-type nuclease